MTVYSHLQDPLATLLTKNISFLCVWLFFQDSKWKDVSSSWRKRHIFILSSFVSLICEGKCIRQALVCIGTILCGSVCLCVCGGKGVPQRRVTAAWQTLHTSLASEESQSRPTDPPLRLPQYPWWVREQGEERKWRKVPKAAEGEWGRTKEQKGSQCKHKDWRLNSTKRRRDGEELHQKATFSFTEGHRMRRDESSWRMLPFFSSICSFRWVEIHD